MEKLKTCPFCGGKATLRSDNPYNSDDVSYVMCIDCQASTRMFPISRVYASDYSAVKAWNMREGDQHEQQTLQK